MTFKDFSRWCNDRYQDGRWGMSEAIFCIELGTTIRKMPFWRREKAWRNSEERVTAEHIVVMTNAKIEKAYPKDIERI